MTVEKKMIKTLGLILKRCAQDKSKSCARKPGGPAQRLIFFRIHMFDETLITQTAQTVKLMELIKMMVKMMVKMMEMMEMMR